MLNEQKLSSSRKNNKGVSEMKFLKGIAFGIMVLMAVFSVSSIETLGNFKQEQCVNLKQICGNCTYVNITSVLLPDSTQIINEVEMTKAGTEYNYTFCNTSILGNYIVSGKGDLDGKDTIFAYDFKITPMGNESSVENSILHFISIGILVFFIILFTYSLIKTDKIYLRIFSFYGIWFFTICLFYQLWVTGENYLYFFDFTGIFFKWCFLLMLFATIPLFFGTLSWVLWIALTEKNIRKMMDRGIPEDRATMYALRRRK